MQFSETFNDFAAAFATAQRDIQGAIKDRTNPAFRSQYADLSSVMEACKGALNGQGIAIMQDPVPSDRGMLTVETTLIHKSGQWAKSSITLPVLKPDVHSYGSALTYARRYGLSSMVGVCPEDDDGNGATAAPQANGTHREPPKPAPRASNRPALTQRPQNAPATAQERVDEVTGEVVAVDSPDELTDDDTFRQAVADGYTARGINVGLSDQMTAQVLEKKKAASLEALSIADRRGFVDAIRSGKFDHLKIKKGIDIKQPATAGKA